MDLLDFGRYVGALLMTLGLLLAGLAALRRWGGRLPLAITQPAGGASAPVRRITVLESRMLDAKRRLVVTRFAGRDHLILLGASGETLIAAEPAADAPAEA